MNEWTIHHEDKSTFCCKHEPLTTVSISNENAEVVFTQDNSVFHFSSGSGILFLEKNKQTNKQTKWKRCPLFFKKKQRFHHYPSINTWNLMGFWFSPPRSISFAMILRITFRTACEANPSDHMLQWKKQRMVTLSMHSNVACNMLISSIRTLEFSTMEDTTSGWAVIFWDSACRLCSADWFAEPMIFLLSCPEQILFQTTNNKKKTNLVPPWFQLCSHPMECTNNRP